MILQLRTHVENLGWQNYVGNGQLSGTVGKNLRIEAFELAFSELGALDLGLTYAAHVENIGWQADVSNGATAGTVGQALRLEALKIELTGTDASLYSVFYRVHVENVGWQEWVNDGGIAGTTGQALQAEAIEVMIVDASQNLNRPTDPGAIMNTKYRSHVENIGWKAWVMNGQSSGTTGLALRMEAIELKLTETEKYDLGISYRAHIQNVGWQEWVSNGETSGTTGQGLRLEAIEIQLTGSDANKFKVMYRGHIENSGWTDWFEDGATLGTTGQSLRAEAFSVIVIKSTDELDDMRPIEIVNKVPYVQVWATDYPRTEFLIHDERSSERIVDMLLTTEVNKPGSFSFTIDPTHKYYNDLFNMRTVISVYEINSNKEKTLIFKGRILETQKGFDNLKKVNCEGELIYLFDSIQRGATYEDQPIEQWLTAVLANHNLSMPTEKRIYMGIVTKLDDTYDELRSHDYVNTYELLQNDLIGNIGGVLSLQYIGGLRFLDYRESTGVVCTQTIRFARNLLDCDSSTDASELATAIVPVGKKEAGKCLTIADVNNGSDYIYNEEGVNLYGWIFKTKEWSDIENAQLLYDRGLDYLNGLLNLEYTLELTAFDLSLVDVDIERINVGDSVRCVSEPHGIDNYMIVNKKVRHLQDPGKDCVTLGDKVATVTQNAYDDKQYLLKKIASIGTDRKAWIEYGNYPLDLTGVEVMFDKVHTIAPVITPSILKNVEAIGGGTETAQNIIITTDMIMELNTDGEMRYVGCNLHFSGTLASPDDFYVSIQIIGTYI